MLSKISGFFKMLLKYTSKKIIYSATRTNGAKHLTQDVLKMRERREIFYMDVKYRKVLKDYVFCVYIRKEYLIKYCLRNWMPAQNLCRHDKLFRICYYLIRGLNFQSLLYIPENLYTKRKISWKRMGGQKDKGIYGEKRQAIKVNL